MLFSQRLKELRNEKNLTQKELALYLGLSANSICEWEKNRCEPNFDSLKKLSELFECSVGYILGVEDDFGNISINTKSPADNLSAEEKELLENFRQLNLLNRMHVSAYAKVRLEEQDDSTTKSKA